VMLAMTPEVVDIVDLNIGGRIFSVKRTTLCQIEGSLLSSMFSGRWEKNLERDENNRVFMDIDPDCFGLILKWLRMLKVNPNAKFPHISDTLKHEMQNWRQYLGVEDPLSDLKWKADSDYFEISGRMIKRLKDTTRNPDIFIAKIKHIRSSDDHISKIEFKCFCDESPDVQHYIEFGAPLANGGVKFDVKTHDHIVIECNLINETYLVECNGFPISDPIGYDLPCKMEIKFYNLTSLILL